MRRAGRSGVRSCASVAETRSRSRSRRSMCPKRTWNRFVKFFCLLDPDPPATFGFTRWGGFSVVSYPLQRLGVSPDGSGVVFEVNDEFLTSPSLSPEQNGMFFVRSDGRGLRRLGPPSHEVSHRQNEEAIGGSFSFSPPMFFSPNGRRVGFTDIGPGPSGPAVQIVVLDLATGKRTQVTHLPSGTPPKNVFGEFFLTCCPAFVDDDTVVFQTFVDPEGSN